MDLKDIQRLRAELTEVTEAEAAARSKAEQFEASLRADGQDPLEATNFAAIDAAYKEADGLTESAVQLREKLARAAQIAGQRAADQVGRNRDAEADHLRAKSAAQRFNLSPMVQELRTSGRLQSAGPLGRTDLVDDVITREEMTGLMRLRAAFDATAGAGLRTPDYTGTLIEVLNRRVRLIDLITVGSTDTDVVDYITEGSQTNAATGVPYGTAPTDSAYSFSHNTTNVVRFAATMPATKGILADAGQTQTLLDNRLVAALYRYLEAQVFSGTGSGQSIEGLTVVSGTNTLDAASATPFDAVHQAITKIRIAANLMLEPTALLIHPTDYQTLVLAKDDYGRYLVGDPTGGFRTVWGLVPVVTPLASVGSPIVADFATAFTLWLRSGVAVSASDQDEDNFKKGLVTLLAEFRAAGKTIQPLAITKISNFG